MPGDIGWLALQEQRSPPTPKDIKAAVKQVKNMPDSGDHGHVPAVLNVYGKNLPAIPQGSWKAAKLQTVKLSKLQASNQQLKRADLIWHIENPGKSRFAGKFNTHPQVLKTKDGDQVVIDGDHRVAALVVLGVKKDHAWVLDEKDIPK